MLLNPKLKVLVRYEFHFQAHIKLIIKPIKEFRLSFFLVFILRLINVHKHVHELFCFCFFGLGMARLLNKIKTKVQVWFVYNKQRKTSFWSSHNATKTITKRSQWPWTTQLAFFTILENEQKWKERDGRFMLTMMEEMAYKGWLQSIDLTAKINYQVKPRTSTMTGSFKGFFFFFLMKELNIQFFFSQQLN